MRFCWITSLGIAATISVLGTAAEPSPASLVVAVGAGGSAEFETQFRDWAARWVRLAEQIGAEIITVGMDDHVADTTDRASLQLAIKNQLTPSSSPLVIVFLGHGTHYQDVAKFNLRGPDVSAKELAGWVNDSPRPIVLIQCSSSSVAFMKELSAEGRIVITATRSSAEQNYSRFGDHFSASLTDPAADLDHDKAISLLESFLFASDRVARFYEQEARLATEHSLLDDNGDELGTPGNFFRGIRAEKAARDNAPLDGIRAHQIVLCRLPDHAALPADRVPTRDTIEQEIELLRTRKPDLEEDQYYAQLEPLLVKLARLYAPNDE